MKNQQGFTLIELIIVIVILGILGVTAAPKFLSLSSDARASTITGLEGALSAGANLVYSKSVMDGEEESADAGLDLDNDGTEDIATVYGYPDVLGVNAFEVDLAFWMDLDMINDWSVETTPGTTGSEPGTATFTIEGYSPQSGTVCNVVYTEAEDATKPATIEANVGGC